MAGMSIEAVKRIVQDDLKECNQEEREAYLRYSVAPYEADLMRYGRPDKVVVIAKNGNEVMYWQEVEEGFNVSPLGASGEVLHHYCNQDSLRQALLFWKARTFG